MSKAGSNNKNIFKHKQKIFRLSVIISLAFVAGIPMIPIGFAGGRIFVGVTGIVLTVAGFYGTPLAWVSYGTAAADARLAGQILTDGIMDITTLCRLNDKPEKIVLQQIKRIISKGYLYGYILINGKLAKLTDGQYATVDISTTLSAQCPFCGAKLQMLNGKGFCTYCGSTSAINSYK